MAVLTACEGIDRVYFELSRHPEWLWPRDPAASIPGGLAEELLSFSNDVATTAWLLLVWQEEHVATDFVRNVQVDRVYEEFRTHAETSRAARERLAEEVDGLIESARIYRDRIWNLIENGVIVDNEQVRDYCSAKLGRMLNAWFDYRERLQKVAGAW